MSVSDLQTLLGAARVQELVPDLASWSSALLELGLAVIILAAFLAFLYATLKSDPYLVAGTRHKELEAHYKERLSASEAMLAELRAENREQHLALERIAEDYKDGINDYKQVILLHFGHTRGSFPFSRGSHSCPQRSRQQSQAALAVRRRRG